MAIQPGTRLGPYEVLSAIGAGGMGEVYRARDTRLNRDVALKVLPEAFSRDGERMARFEREAKLLASLNHPNIAAIYGLEESGPIYQGGLQVQPGLDVRGLQVQPAPVRALVMELVEGPTLAERIRSGEVAKGQSGPGKAGVNSAIPIDEALPIARQVADAVEYAHDNNVIHRDLKPANIKVKEDGTVKVLDFGLAKAMSDEPTVEDMANSPTLSMAATQQGVILGTAAYMSPEQAKGKQVVAHSARRCALRRRPCRAGCGYARQGPRAAGLGRVRYCYLCCSAGLGRVCVFSARAGRKAGHALSRCPAGRLESGAKDGADLRGSTQSFGSLTRRSAGRVRGHESRRQTAALGSLTGHSRRGAADGNRRCPASFLVGGQPLPGILRGWETQKDRCIGWTSPHAMRLTG
jgi:serine/threonine protein kinase